MKADMIIRNAKIFTSNRDSLLVTALAVKDGRFIYAGDEAGLSDYEGEVTDLCGKFIMPGIIDSHVHVTMPVGFEYKDMGEYIVCDSKKGALDFISDHIKNHPGRESYNFLLERVFLHGEEITKEDLDAVCADSEIMILEGEAHSYVGDEEGIKEWIGDATEVIDCHGKSVIPGPGDAHMHLAHVAK